jgi:hypothetical protein
MRYKGEKKIANKYIKKKEGEEITKCINYKN